MKKHYFTCGELALWLGSLALIIAAFCIWDRTNFLTLAASLVGAVLPWALAFSAGAMIAVSCSELIPSGVAGGKVSSVFGIAAGFAVMMFLDVLLG